MKKIQLGKMETKLEVHLLELVKVNEKLIKTITLITIWSNILFSFSSKFDQR